ncbi:MAG: hypothetical protein ACTHWJ_06370 [Flaviflexus sp.]|nr:hypothetical protein [Flaviflexus ciconiae]
MGGKHAKQDHEKDQDLEKKASEEVPAEGERTDDAEEQRED